MISKYLFKPDSGTSRRRSGIHPLPPLLNKWVHTTPNTVLDSFFKFMVQLCNMHACKIIIVLYQKQAVLCTILNYIVDHFNIFVRIRSDISGTGGQSHTPPSSDSLFSFTVHLCNMGALQIIALKKKNGQSVLCTIRALLPKPQTDNYITLQAFPWCLSVNPKSSVQCIVCTVEIGEGRLGTAAGVHGWQRGRCLPQKHRIFSHAACPTGAKMTAVSYSGVARALSREGNNLGAVSLHCVLLFPQVRGGYLSQQEENNA